MYIAVMPKQALNQGRGERMMSVLSVFLRNPNRSYSAPDILNNLELPESQIRNVQRDLESLADFEAGSLLKKEGEKTHAVEMLRLNFSKDLLLWIASSFAQ